jgi:polyphosphate kinase
VLTASEAIGEDIGDLFNMLTGYADPGQFRSIVISPDGIHRKLLQLIEAEIEFARRGKTASIVCKMNNLVDPQMIGALYRASQAGVQIQLVVRGVCCLRPGVQGMSENIQVRSIVGRFLEHSRVFRFANDGQPLIYISSGDWMQRNFFSRVEIMTPIEDTVAKTRLQEEVLELSWNDVANSWELRSDGSWRHRSSSHSQPMDSHSLLIQREQVTTHTAIDGARVTKKTTKGLHPAPRKKRP